MRPRHDFVIASVSTALAIGLAATSPAQKGGGKPPPSAPPDKIAFVRTLTSGGNQLFTMRSDGSQQTQITPFSGSSNTECWFPSWLPDGRIVYGQYSTDFFRSGLNAEIWARSHDGTNPQRIAIAPDCYLHPGTDFTYVRGSGVWDVCSSPDGSFVAFDAGSKIGGPCAGGVYVVRKDGIGGPVLVATHDESFPTTNGFIVSGWSPDLSPDAGYQGMLLFGRLSSAGISYSQLKAKSIATDSDGNPLILGGETLVMDRAALAAWSPDGRRLAMVESSALFGTWTGNRLVAIPVPWTDGQPVFPAGGLDPGTRYQVGSTTGYYFERGLNWSPDGKSLVVNFNGDIHKVAVPATGGGTAPLIKLTTNRSWEGHGSWSPPVF